MGTLLIARVRVGRDVLVALSRDDALQGGTIRRLLRRAAKYVNGIKRQGYRLRKGRITEFVTQEISDDIDTYRLRFADFSLRWSSLSPGTIRDCAMRFGPQHLVDAEREHEIGELLFNFEWMQAKLDATDASSLIRDFDQLEDDKGARLIRGTLILSSHVLVKDKSQLAGQLLGRLLGTNEPRVQHMLGQACRYTQQPGFAPFVPA
jgi:hypothetical protein